MPRKLRQLRAELRRAGCYIYSQKGSHERWIHALVPNGKVTLAGHDGEDAKPYQEKEVRELLRLIAEAKRRTRP